MVWHNDLWQYEYNLTDHLGNVRVVFAVNQQGTAELRQNTDYYPFGMIMNQKNYYCNDCSHNKFLYNSKELQDDVIAGKKLDWYDYGARFYDPQIGRWHVIDPHAENYLPVSPYAYVANNPIIFIDPDGRDLWHFNERGEIVHHDPSYKDADKFVRVSYNDEGQVVKGNSISFEYGTILGINSVKAQASFSVEVDGNSENVTVFGVNNDSNGTSLFEFFCQNTIVEFSQFKLTSEMGTEFNTISTTHLEAKEVSVRYLGPEFDKHNVTIRGHSHNHPDNSNFPSTADRNFSRALFQRNPNVITTIFLPGQNRYIYYNEFGKHAKPFIVE